jgi:hypothetical protein
MMELIPIAKHGVIKRHDGSAGNAEHHLHATADQRFTHDLGTRSLTIIMASRPLV